MTIYRLNHVEFDTTLNVLTRDGEQQPLDPKLADLLHLFVRHPGQIMSRDELLQHVWGDTIVSDNTINWSVSQLRKALGDDAKTPRFIKTVSKKGYQCVADVSRPEGASKSHPSVHQHKSKRRWPYALAGLFLLAAIALLVERFSAQTEHNTKVVQSSPLTSLAGHESGGELSEDGLFLAFLHRPLNGEYFQIYLKPMKENIRLPVESRDADAAVSRQSNRSVSPFAITSDAFTYHQVIWGADDYQLIAVRSDPNTCEVVLMSLALNRQQISQVEPIMSCATAGRTRIALGMEGDLLYVTAAPEGGTTQNLYRIELNSLTVTELLTGSADGAGYKFVHVNHRTGKLLLLEDKYWRETAFSVFDPGISSVKNLFQIESVYYSAYWSNQADKIWFNWSNQTVMEYDINTDTSTPILTTTAGWNYDFHPVSANRAVYSVSDADSSNLVFLHDGQSQSTPTTYTEYGPAFSPKGGRYAFVSNQTGLPQIWLNDGKAESQLTDVESYREFYDIAWTADGDGLIAVEGKTIGKIDLARNTFKTLFTAVHKPFMPSLSPDKNVLAFSLFYDARWHVQIVTMPQGQDSSETIAQLEGANKAVLLDSQRVLYSENEADGLWLFDLTAQQRQMIWSGFPASIYWELSGTDLIYAHDGSIFRCHDVLNRGCGARNVTLITTFPPRLTGRFSYDKRSGKVVMVDRLRPEANLRLAEIIN